MKTRHLIIGGAGFIGCNLASSLLEKNEEVEVLDNFSRIGTKENAKWLKENYPDIKITKGDVRDFNLLIKKIKKADVVYHLAAQVAVTKSVENPRKDFEVNALGTFNILEAMRISNKDAILLYSSTNKVYGKMENIPIVEKEKRYEYKNLPKGVSEDMPLDFYSPYGCSKGCGDQYVRDYARIYGLKTVVFRQSCIYGPHQFGIEDQGWVAWFTIASILGKPITIYGDGKQVRDVLHVDDLIKVYELAIKKIDSIKGQIYNIGGGVENTLSLLELIEILEKLTGKKINYKFEDWRPGDQKVYISDITKAKQELGWEPKIDSYNGVKNLMEWVKKNSFLFK